MEIRAWCREVREEIMKKGRFFIGVSICWVSELVDINHFLLQLRQNFQISLFCLVMKEAFDDREKYARHASKTPWEEMSTGLKALSPLPNPRLLERGSDQHHDFFGERPIFQLARPLVELFDYEHKSPVFTPRKGVISCGLEKDDLLCTSPFPEEKSNPFPAFDLGTKAREKVMLGESPFK